MGTSPPVAATGQGLLLRFLRFTAYEARNRNATVEGLPASINYSKEKE